MDSPPDRGLPRLPPDYEWTAMGRWRLAVYRDCRETLAEAGAEGPGQWVEAADTEYRGRGRPVGLRLPDGRRAVLRRYLHGGVRRRICPSLFLGAPRPVMELRATDRARRAGVRVPLVLAAIHRRRGPFHEGYLLTEEIPGAENLDEVLRTRGGAAALLHRVGREMARMHEAGVWHADLHARNVLVREGDVVLLDFDRARIMDPVPQAKRDANLLRFDRSLIKLGLAGPVVSITDRFRLFTGHAGGRIARDRRDRLAARCRRSVGRHRMWWRFSR